MTVMSPTAPCTVAYTRGQPPWTAWAHGARTARAVAIARHARRPTRCVAFAPTAGTCLHKQNGTPCSMQSVDHRSPEQCSSPRPGGIAMAMARMRSRSRRCLPATGTTMVVPTARASTRISGVLLGTIDMRASCTCTTATTLRTYATAIRSTGIVFVVSRTSSEANRAELFIPGVFASYCLHPTAERKTLATSSGLSLFSQLKVSVPR